MDGKWFDKNTSVDVYHERMKELMQKELEEIEKDLEMHPEITAIKVPDEIKKRIDVLLR